MKDLADDASAWPFVDVRSEAICGQNEAICKDEQGAKDGL